MAADTARLFGENQKGILTPILPPDQSMAGPIAEKYISSIFANVVTVPAAGVAITSSAVFKPDKNMIADLAVNAGNYLREIQGAKSDIGYAGGAAMKLGGEMIGAIFGTVRGENPEPEPDLKIPPPVQAPAFSPSPGG
jgi:hypothetical protein